MDTKSNTKPLVFASDKPVFEDKLGTHKHLADLIAEIVLSKSDNPLVIGVFGGWGTGKSSIARMYEKISSEKKIRNVYVDSWVFANAKDRFASGLLKQLALDLTDESESSKIIKQIDQRYEKWNTVFDLSRSTWQLLLSTLLIFLGSVFLAIWLIGNIDKPEFELLIFMITTVVVNGLLNWVLPKIMVTYESRTVDESYSKVEHFRLCFTKIMEKSEYENISVVVDNLDRVEPADALEMIRMLKTFINEDILSAKRFVLIVPCDKQTLAEHIEKQLYIEDAHEFLQKFFNISVTIPELIREDIVNFTKNELDYVRDNLNPSLSEDNVNLVSFVISRAAKRNPRQIKSLINNFISFWQAAGLVGTADKSPGISALGAVIYISLSYLQKGRALPRNLSDIFASYANFEKETSNDLIEFLDSVKDFQNQISDYEWAYLRRLQMSDNEKLIPNFIDIYFAITDSRWAVANSYISNDTDLSNLISRLDIKTRDEGAISRERFLKWVLSLIANFEVSANQLPPRVKDTFDFALSRYENDWKSLIDEGLVN